MAGRKDANGQPNQRILSRRLVRHQIRLVRLFGASRVQVLTKIVLPGSVPIRISTLKVNVGLALVGVVVGEFQAAKAGLAPWTSWA